MIKIDIEKSFKLAIDIIVCFLILLQSIKKGGFYTSDIYFFINSITMLICIYGLFFVAKYFANRSKNKCEKFSLKNVNNVKNIIICFASLSMAYLLPIILNKCANIDDSQFEFLRYISIFILYVIIRNSDHKKIYFYTLISIGVGQAFIGIDGLASRILQPYFELIDSGYLGKDLTRLSGNIQYANTAAILIAISGILILDKLHTYIAKIKESNNIFNRLKISISFSLFTVMTLAIILTGSRMVLFMYTVAIIVYLIKSKANVKNMLLVLGISYGTSFLASNNILDLVVKNPSKVYIVFLTYIVLSFILIRYITKYFILNKTSNKNFIKFKFNKMKIAIIFSAVIIGYILIGLNVYKPLELTGNTKSNITSRQIYGVKTNGINNIDITFKNNSSDSKYSITVYEENDKYVQSLVTKFEYYNNDTNSYNYNFTAAEDTKRLNVVFTCYKGDISITQFKLNNEIKPLEYSLLPNDMVFRFIDFLNGSTSSRDRIEYLKDSYKIWLTSPIVGRGGEGFKHLYKSVQTLKYTSSEAHNSIVQIFVESGIIGGISICIIIYIVLKENKYSVLKLAFIMFVLHSLTDLNFSFFISLIAFSMLIGIMDDKKEMKE